MNTPIYDFVTEYIKKNVSRMHMPGHKGRTFLGCEARDITEIHGADVLHHGQGIIQESQKNASGIFGTGSTFYSTEGSSLCIKAMLEALAWHGTGKKILAARNVHRSMIDACGLLDLEVLFVSEENQETICSSKLTSDCLEQNLRQCREKPLGVYVTSPDYLGNCQDIAGLSKICEKYDVPLVVDNAHGAYLHFLEPSQHPMDLGAAMCCDSAHKTLPVLTGGAYLHVSHKWDSIFGGRISQGMALFGSTSPSYLILQSLDLCNQYLSQGYKQKLAAFLQRLIQCRKIVEKSGYCMVSGQDPLKITFWCKKMGITGKKLETQLREHGMECEYADESYVVLMFTPENTEEEIKRLEDFCKENPQTIKEVIEAQEETEELLGKVQRVCSIRQALFSPSETVKAEDAEGRICGAETVACPPAIPIAICGEVITKEMTALFQKYGIEEVSVLVNGDLICYTS